MTVQGVKMLNFLIVDDSPIIIKMLNFVLTTNGYNVQSANSAEDALALAAEQEYDIGIFDINMPGENGIFLTENILKLPQNSKMKVIILTTESDEPLKQQATAAGAVAWLQKPFVEDDLLGLLAEVKKTIG